MTLLRVRELSKRFGGVTALAGVSFDVAAGDVLGVVGPNGAGKSTLFHLISGHLTPSSGVVELRGRPITRWPVERRVTAGVARTFQQTRLFFNLSVADNVHLGAYRHRPGGARALLLGEGRACRQGLQRRVDEVLALTGLTRVSNQVAGALSYGFQRRLEVAVALATDPVLLLLDEPFSGQSPQSVAEMGRLLRALRTQGRTLLLIEHRMESIVAECTRVLVLRNGRLLIPSAREDAHVVRA